jgi:diguanylate cyclase (GGDEF)-like protein
MSTAPPASSSPSVGADAPRPVRVIVVGRTALAGVDAALRTDRSIELIRARSPLAAIGEAANPIDDSSPLDLTVVVSPEAIEEARTELFARGIRRIAPHARLLCLGDRVLGGFDARLMSNSADSVREQVRHTVAPVVDAPPAPIDPATPLSPPTEPAATVVRSPATELVAPEVAMATGHDPVAAALELLRQRWNLTNAWVLPAPSEDVGASPPEGAVAVAFNGRVLAHLFTQPAIPADAAAGEARALAPWILLARQQEQLRHAAFTDELTGAWNRRYFNRFLGAAIADAAEKRHTVTLLVFDIDNFKIYNDRFGHAAGDEILVETVRLLNHAIRATDRVCRIGGDEFAVIFHDPTGPRGGTGGPTSPQSIAEIVRRFQKAICAHQFPKLSELAPGTLTISGGMATFPWDGRTVQQLLDRADELSMQSKNQGKNKITFGPGAAQVCGA